MAERQRLGDLPQRRAGQVQASNGGVVLGSRQYSLPANGTNDRDFALFRVALDERLFGNSFE